MPNDILAVIKSRPATIPDGSSDTVIQSYIDEALPVLLGYCNALPVDATAVPDSLKYPWVEIATTLMNGTAALTTGTVTQLKEGDSTVTIGSKKTAQADLFDSLSINNVRIMNRFRTLF